MQLRRLWTLPVLKSCRRLATAMHGRAFAGRSVVHRARRVVSPSRGSFAKRFFHAM